MAAKLTVENHYVLPVSPYAGTTWPYDVARSGSNAPSGEFEWLPVRFSRLPTKLPLQTDLADLTQMVFCPFREGWLFTKAVPKNELWEMFRDGMLGPTMDLVAPGLNPLIGAAVHGAIGTVTETRAEMRDNKEYAQRTFLEFTSLPYLDVFEIDWREMGSFWSMHGPTRHLTITYRDALGARDVVTLVGANNFQDYVTGILRGRYKAEMRAENGAVIDSFVDPDARTEFLFDLNRRAEADPSLRETGARLREFEAFRVKHLAERGITNEMVVAKARERALAALERYRGLPEADVFIASLATPAAEATPPPAQD